MKKDKTKEQALGHGFGFASVSFKDKRALFIASVHFKDLSHLLSSGERNERLLFRFTNSYVVCAYVGNEKKKSKPSVITTGPRCAFSAEK